MPPAAALHAGLVKGEGRFADRDGVLVVARDKGMPPAAALHAGLFKSGGRFADRGGVLVLGRVQGGFSGVSGV